MNGAPAPMTLLLGGVRSGKSARAVALAVHAARDENRVLFAATAGLHDDDMRQRAQRHRAERPAAWRTIEEPLNLASALDAELGTYDVAIVDCMTLWVSTLMLSREPVLDELEIALRVDELIAVQVRSGAHWIVVSNEVGLGIVPPTALGRAYRDALGRANQCLAAAADQVDFMAAGLALRLKG